MEGGAAACPEKGIIMQTSVIGFPRIGTLRELKFASEKYFRGEIGAQELLQTAAQLRKIHWSMQRNAGIDYISSNDFSHYDAVLDTAVMLGIVPGRYKELKLSELDTYFAMARGYQGDSGDVKALAMKKWFNTNYHYIVPEVEDDTVIGLYGSKLLDEYKQAKSIGIDTKPVVIGVYTMLRLCRFTGSMAAADYVDDFIKAYKELLKSCAENQVAWIQFDEPALVQDMDDKDIELFCRIYDAVLSCKNGCRVLLQTYFGDVRDIYANLTGMAFDGIGLDFIEGRETVKLIEKYGFPQDKLLFAGLVNGKNIWRNHYDRTLKTLAQLKEKNINVVLSTSCSLLHVPYTLKHEHSLSQDYLSHFAFAEEKLGELHELGILVDSDDYTSEEAYIDNQQLFTVKRDCENEQVKQRLESVGENDYIRLPKRSERQKIQKKVFGLPEFPTTTIGSFPQTQDVSGSSVSFAIPNPAHITTSETPSPTKPSILIPVILQNTTDRIVAACLWK